MHIVNDDGHHQLFVLSNVAGNMRRDDHIGHGPKGVIWRQRLAAEDIETGASDVIVVRTASSEVLFPFVRHVVTEVDMVGRRIVVDWPTAE